MSIFPNLAPFSKEDIISKAPSKEEYLTLQYSSAM
jgi:hypothetical protein